MTGREDASYEASFNPNLPWGYWLVAKGETDSGYPLVDLEGRTWRSVREAFWISRLGMSNVRSSLMHQELEFLLAVLVAIDRRIIGTEEQAMDLCGSWDKARFYACWLQGQRLTSNDFPSALKGPLTLEGRAVLVMLASTRSPGEAPLPIGLPTITRWHGLNQGLADDERDRIIAEHERAALHLQYRFTRAAIGEIPAIVLSGAALGPNIPLTRKLWSMTFLDHYARDRIWLWLYQRIDRWQPWGELAYERGARALSEHLLQVRFADEVVEVRSG